jgi:hypothetical protein
MLTGHGLQQWKRYFFDWLIMYVSARFIFGCVRACRKLLSGRYLLDSDSQVNGADLLSSRPTVTVVCMCERCSLFRRTGICTNTPATTSIYEAAAGHGHPDRSSEEGGGGTDRYQLTGKLTQGRAAARRIAVRIKNGCRWRRRRMEGWNLYR